MKAYVGAKSGDISLGGAAAGKTKLSNDYAAKNYAAVIADGDALQKAGALDAATAAGGGPVLLPVGQQGRLRQIHQGSGRLPTRPRCSLR